MRLLGRCNPPRDPIAEAKDAKIDRHIAAQDRRISLLSQAVERNERAAAEMLRRLREDFDE